jgi:hypothetical protein
MIRSMGLALAVSLAVFAVRAGAEEAKKEGDSIVGKKFTLTDKAATATFTGVVVGREKAVLKVKIEKIEGVTEWKGPKGEAGQVKVGETLGIFAQWEKGENGKWRPAKSNMEVFRKLRVGDKVEGGLYFEEHPRLACITVTARGEGERHPEKRPEEKKPEEKKKPEGGEANDF